MTMNTLYDFYTTDLQPVLIEQERERKLVKQTLRFLSVFLFVAVIWILGGFLVQLIQDDGFKDLTDSDLIVLPILSIGIALQVCIPAMGIWFFSRRRLLRSHKRNAKQATLSKVIQYIDPGLEYNARASIGDVAIRDSGLFNIKANIYGEDLIFGNLKGLDFSCSELHIKPKVFKGLFAEVRLPQYPNRYPKSVIYVLPKNIVNTFKGKLTMLDTVGVGKTGRAGKAGRGLERIKLEDPLFDRHFIVYASDQLASRMILTTKLMSDISNFREKKKVSIMLSIKADKLYIAVPSSQNLFEPNMSKSYLSPDFIRLYLKELEMVTTLIEDISTLFPNKDPEPVNTFRS